MYSIVQCLWIADELNLLEAQMAGGETISNAEMIDCGSHIGLVSSAEEVPLGLIEHWQFVNSSLVKCRAISYHSHLRTAVIV